MYLRFVVPEIDRDSGYEIGVFQALWKLRDQSKFSQHEEEEHDSIRAWFNVNLERPTRCTASKPPHYRKPNKAISWFKDSAQLHLAKIRALTAILENHDVAVRMIRSERVGYVVYEDEFQVVA
jgi:hypothetical protein